MHKFSKYQRQAYAVMERRILEFWRENDVFKASVEQRPADNAYVFYDGPPFITGEPHDGTLLASIVKDAVPRFQTMRGKRVERRWGWDCHGLPAENLVEKNLNLKDKQAVLDYGLEKYIVACRQNMIQTGSLWEESIDRIGRWVEFKNAYKTMDAPYMESVWWAFKQLYEKGLIYEGEKVLVYCTRCATPISKAEVAMDNSYKTVSDPSVFVKFALQPASAAAFLQEIGLLRAVEGSEINLLAWTTTPWTLPANTALAVNPELDYALIAFGGATYISAATLVGKVFTDENDEPLNIEPLKVFKGDRLVDLLYQPLFADEDTTRQRRVLPAAYVTDADGSGVVHVAPAYGEEDSALAERFGLEAIKNVDDNGFYDSGPWRGQNVWRANGEIAQVLLESGKALKLAQFEHSYPHCHRCATRLMYKAHPSWFMDIAQQRDQMLADNDLINWFPDHLKHGRFKATVESAPDWNISRDRIWATPLPVWRGREPRTGEQKTIVVGSYKELEDLSGRVLEDYHRPWVDEIKFEKDGVVYHRLDKVLDCWFESGSMPFAQHHYPFENREVLENNFPADFIVEYVGQVRTWFYYLHALGIALFGKPAFSNVIVTGTILGDDGRKLSKSLGNYVDPLQRIEQHSADAYRLVLISSPVLAAEDFSLTDKDMADKQRKLDTLRNTLEFFLLYAAADDWRADPLKHAAPPPQVDNVFDKWLLVRLSELSTKLTQNFEEYNLPGVGQPLMEFIDDLSNWYVRRNRKRFWKAEDSADKQAAYHVLYFTLCQLAHLIAPVCPFLAEEMYACLGGSKQSVHLADWPQIEFADEALIEAMHRTRRCITAGLARRAEQGIKVRQPLAGLTVTEVAPATELDANFKEIILEELNVKSLEFKTGSQAEVVLDTEIGPELRQEGLVREVVRRVQILRKTAGLEVENRISLSLAFRDDFLLEACRRFEDYIKSETLALALHFGHGSPTYGNKEVVELEGVKLVLSLEKHSSSSS